MSWFWDEVTVQMLRLLPRRTARCCLQAALIVLVTSLTCAQQLPPVASRPATLAPEPAEAMQAYRLVDGWIRAWNLPEKSDLAFSHASVTLRLENVIVGRGTSLDDSGSALREAARQAMEQAETRLRWPHDAVGEQARRAEAKEIRISLELGGIPEPVEAGTWTEFDLLVQPGLEGVAVRAGERMQTMFPSQMMSMAHVPSDAAVALIARISRDDQPVFKMDAKDQPDALAKRLGVVFYRFRVIHLAQVAPRAEPIFLTRGGRLVAEQQMNSAALRELSINLAENFGRRVMEGTPARLLAALHPGRRTNDAAGAFETLLAVHALREFSTLDSVQPAARQRALTLADGLLAGVADEIQHDVEDGPSKVPVTVQAAAIIAATTPCDSVSPANNELVNRFRTLGRVFDAEKGWREEVKPPMRAMVALAMVRLAARGADAADQGAAMGLAEAAVRSLYRETTPKMLVMHMPYLGWAELELCRGQEKVGAAGALEQMRDEILEHQLTAADAGLEGEDMVGGIVFTTTAHPMPTWLSCKAGVFLGTMARDGRLTGRGTEALHVVKVARLCRFVMQLAADEVVASSMAEPERSLWGVRSSTWDCRQPLEAQAMGLMMVTEGIRMSEELARRSGAGSADQK